MNPVKAMGWFDAHGGLYTQLEVQRGLPVRLLVKYFRKVGAQWQIDEALRRQVALQQANLLHDLGHLGRFDIVFCRNVLIYFDAATRRAVLARIAAMMPDDGYLVLGGAETVLGVSDAFTAVPGERGVYRAGGPTAVPIAKSA